MTEINETNNDTNLETDIVLTDENKLSEEKLDVNPAEDLTEEITEE